MVHKKKIELLRTKTIMIGSLFSKNNNYETIQPMTSGFAV
jgi:hypothetical protein